MSDINFIRFLHILIHVLLTLALARLFLESVRQFQDHDEVIRTIVADRTPAKCTNYSEIIDHILTQKNETGLQILLSLAYLMSTFTASVLVLSHSRTLVSLFTLFQVGVLGANLIHPVLTPYLSVACFVASTTLNLTYLLVAARSSTRKSSVPKVASRAANASAPDPDDDEDEDDGDDEFEHV